MVVHGSGRILNIKKTIQACMHSKLFLRVNISTICSRSVQLFKSFYSKNGGTPDTHSSIFACAAVT